MERLGHTEHRWKYTGCSPEPDKTTERIAKNFTGACAVVSGTTSESTKPHMAEDPNVSVQRATYQLACSRVSAIGRAAPGDDEGQLARPRSTQVRRTRTRSKGRSEVPKAREQSRMIQAQSSGSPNRCRRRTTRNRSASRVGPNVRHERQPPAGEASWRMSARWRG